MGGRWARTAALLLAAGAPLLGAGCGSGSSQNPEELRLERVDLVLTARALASEQAGVGRLAQSAKAAWPYVANGLPRRSKPIARQRIAEAALQAAALRVPGLFSEEGARGLTGPASSIAGTYAGFVRLATRGWRLLNYSLEQIERGTVFAAHFARANVALYIESVYDAQFEAAQIGKQLLPGYKRLGGPAAFAGKLTQAEVLRLAAAYSEPRLRLYPHATVKLGS